MFKHSAFALTLTLGLIACSADAPSADSAAATPAKPLLLVPADLLDVQPRSLNEGPVISGSLQPELRADLRAEVSGVVLDVLKDNGDPVRQGDVLVRLDPTAIRDKLLSAQEAERAAAVGFEQAERQLKRMQSMAAAGLIAASNLETAESARNQSQSELASARARVVEARQQMEKTAVRAPFEGIVGSLSVSAGDTAQMGMALLSVIDPASMRFEGMIAAESVGQVKPGDAVSLRINGYPNQTFDGQVQRVNPIANEATRQVQVLVTLPASDRPLVAGLFAEGHIQVRSREALLVPDSSVLREGDASFVWQVKDGVLHKQAVVIGAQDTRLGEIEVTSGLAAGEQVLRHPLGALKEGAAVAVEGASAGPVVNVAAATEN